MFRDKTVFVVGAGASAEVGLPIGSKLKDAITEMLNFRFEFGQRARGGDDVIFETCHRLASELNGGNINSYMDACRIIRRAMPVSISIDNCLEQHSDNELVVRVGKIAIVRSILEAEKSSALYVDRRSRKEIDISDVRIQSSWYVALFKKLTESVPRNRIETIFQNVSFIVFNYDRCIEMFLHSALQAAYGISDVVAGQVLAHAEFIHPYGVVGALPWQPSATHPMSFGETIDTYALKNIARGIHTYSEQIESGDVLDLVRTRLQGAATVVYLGFAFHPQNMALLKIPAHGTAMRVFGTAMGASEDDREIISRAIRSSLNLADLINVKLGDFSCARLFDEYSRSIAQA